MIDVFRRMLCRDADPDNHECGLADAAASALRWGALAEHRHFNPASFLDPLVADISLQVTGTKHWHGMDFNESV